MQEGPSENDCVEKQSLGFSLICRRLFWFMADINAAACQSTFADNMDANQSSGVDLYYSLIAEEVAAMQYSHQLQTVRTQANGDNVSFGFNRPVVGRQTCQLHPTDSALFEDCLPAAPYHLGLG